MMSTTTEGTCGARRGSRLDHGGWPVRRRGRVPRQLLLFPTPSAVGGPGRGMLGGLLRGRPAARGSARPRCGAGLAGWGADGWRHGELDDVHGSGASIVVQRRRVLAVPAGGSGGPLRRWARRPDSDRAGAAMALGEGSFGHVYKLMLLGEFGEYVVMRLKSVATSRERCNHGDVRGRILVSVDVSGINSPLIC
ncbi:hypothetical protein EJB05_13593, partial [Eragrostis curvula]